ncbi:hypothetical protein CPB83DRAFT_123964 [Crepidotus variabilis]|uniref:Uncharacterized protein n=1 Tax=Crepidotus variabilis TaxID=179855 RepID=A0A9P6JSP3_9AGAR|nr:hypothetical protein CPB83DRAFT_123964 [Crepidotus variabilis]
MLWPSSVDLVSLLLNFTSCFEGIRIDCGIASEGPQSNPEVCQFITILPKQSKHRKLGARCSKVLRLRTPWIHVFDSLISDPDKPILPLLRKMLAHLFWVNLLVGPLKRHPSILPNLEAVAYILDDPAKFKRMDSEFRSISSAFSVRQLSLTICLLSLQGISEWLDKHSENAERTCSIMTSFSLR